MTSLIRAALVRGVASIAATGALLGAPAFAGTEMVADKQAPEQAAQTTEIAQAEVIEVVEVEQGTGWYLTIGAGAAWPSSTNIRTSDFPTNFDFDANYGGGFSVDGGIGYDFGAIRTELTYGYTRASLNEITVGDFDVDASGIINKNDVMASAYWDIDTNSRFVPYIGGGVGYSNFSTPSFDVAGIRTDSVNKGLFGWQAKVGVAYVVNWNSDVYVEGTYSGASGFYTGDLHFDSYNDFGVKAGFRYRFGSPAVVVVEAPAPEPAPEPAPAPAPEPEPAPAPIRGLW
jgi:opacity protein-like surface antigen